MAEPVKLAVKSFEAKCNQSTIELLEKALLEAKAGALQEVVILGFRPNGDTMLLSSPLTEANVKLGAIEQYKFDLLMARYEGGQG